MIGSYRLGMDPVHYSSHAQHLAGAVYHQLQPDGHCHHPFHHPSPRAHTSPHGEANTSDAGHEFPPASAEGDSNPLRQGPHPDIPGNDADLPRSRRQPGWLFGPAGNTDAHPHRIVPGPRADLIHIARPISGAFGKDISLPTLLAELSRGPAGFRFYRNGFSQRAGLSHNHSDSGVCYHLGPAEDDYDAIDGPSPAGQSDDDAVDDALANSLLFLSISHRAGHVLDSFQPNRHRNTILCNRVATAFPAVSQGRASSCAGGAS